MAAWKTFFEQIPVETVKRIAKEFPDGDATERNGANTELPTEGSPPGASWREVAEKVQQERDPKRIAELVEQLIVSLDKEKLCEDQPPKPRP